MQMAQKLAPGIYQISPLETLSLTINGPNNPIVALDGSILPVALGASFSVTPQMLNGLGAHHMMRIMVPFLGGGGSYTIDVASSLTVGLDQLVKTGPDVGSQGIVVITIFIQ
jgi:hypothetical protein